MMYGYAGKILKVDLTAGTLTDIDSSQYLPTYLGGIGLGWRILWEYTNANTTEWSPENTLTFASGPVNGGCIPTAGRTEVIGIAPYGYPKPWACESGAGGDWSTKLKWCGYDAVIVTGISASPVYLHIDDNGPQLLDARSLWGAGTFSVQERMETLYGKNTATLCTGIAGENLSRLATIETNGENSMGQGGFGAVLGYKKLKCLSVTPGSHKITFASPEGMIRVAKQISYELGPITPNNLVSSNNTAIKADAASTSSGTGYISRRISCPYSNCQVNDHDCLYWTYNRVPDTRGHSDFTATCGCTGGSGMTGGVISGPSRNVANELHNLECNWGINTWANIFNTLISQAHTYGLTTEVDGYYLNTSHQLSVDQFILWMRDLATSSGPEGAVWAQGGARAAAAFGWGDSSADGDPVKQGLIAWQQFKHGYAPHWDGRNQGNHFPMWVGAALDWAVWGRDPFNDSHGWPERVPWYVLEWGGKSANKDMVGRDAIPYATLQTAAAKLYGTTGAISNASCPNVFAGWPGLPDDTLGYTDKEYAMYWHNHQEWFKNCMVMCDAVFPLLYSSEAPDSLGYYNAEEDAFNAATGLNWTTSQCHQAAERIFNLMRAVHVRQGRTRAHDESVIRYFTDVASGASAYEQRNLNKAEFQALLSRYYVLRGWDATTGLPTITKLNALGLSDVATSLNSIVKLPA